MTTLDMIITFGLGSIKAADLHWVDDTHFSLVATRNVRDIAPVSLAVAKGFIPALFDGRIYIESVHEIKEGWCCDPVMPMDAIITGRTVSAAGSSSYLTLGSDWLSIARALDKELDKACKTPPFGPACRTPLMRLQREFYRSPAQIELHHRHRNNVSLGGFSFDVQAPDIAYHDRFDSQTMVATEASELFAFIEREKRRKDSVLLLSFLDEQDPLSQAQGRFIHMLLPCLRRQFPHLRLHVIDVVVRDRQGAEAYEEVFLAYTSERDHGSAGDCPEDRSAPFSILFSGGQSGEGDEIDLGLCAKPPPAAAGSGPDECRILDMDLFAGCRKPDQSRTDRRRQFEANRAAALHAAMRYAAQISSVAEVYPHDFRGHPKLALARDVLTLSKSSIVVQAGADRGDKAIDLAVRASAHAILTGYPWITTILEDTSGSPDTVRVHIPGTAEQYYYDVPRELDDDDVLAVVDSIVSAYRESPDLSALLARTS
ncbi:MAG: hypothetical protein AAFY02_14260 [Pseudomonadota bacterium]